MNNSTHDPFGETERYSVTFMDETTKPQSVSGPKAMKIIIAKQDKDLIEINGSFYEHHAIKALTRLRPEETFRPRLGAPKMSQEQILSSIEAQAKAFPQLTHILLPQAERIRRRLEAKN